MAIYITQKGDCRSMKIEMDKLADGQKKKKHAPSSAKPLKARIVNARQSTKTKVIDLDLMKDHNYLTRTEATLTRIYPLMPKGSGKYEMNGEQAAVSIVMKLILKTDATNPMTPDWTNILWNITQQDNLLPQGCSVTFVRVMERVDDTIAQKKIKGRSNLALMTSDTYSNEGKKKQSIYTRHDAGLLAAIDHGDCVVAFGAEAIITAPDELALEEAMEAVKNYLKMNDETRGLSWELDLNRQLQPFILYGPNEPSKNKDVFVNMSSSDAAISSLFVDSGGDRLPGSEYVGVSVGKMISSHAAYLLQNDRTMVVGNDTVNKTFTLMGNALPQKFFDLPSQIYWSFAMSRAYLLSHHKVTHFVLDHAANVPKLMEFPLYDRNKTLLDLSRGLLNILEVVGATDLGDHPERITGRFATHLNNIIALLSQYRDVDEIKTTDDFASVTRQILTDFFVANKYYTYDAMNHPEDVRLTAAHSQYKTLADLGGWIAERRKSNRDRHLDSALAELNIIINENILPTIPALNVRTSDAVDDMLSKPYRVLDLTGMSVGAISLSGDSTTNVMMIAYLNLVLPTLENGDAIFFHGFTKVAGIADILQEMIASCGRRVCVVFTESNQNSAQKLLPLLNDTLDLSVVDLYKNSTDKIQGDLKIDGSYAQTLMERPGAFFMGTRASEDYIFLDHIL